MDYDINLLPLRQTYLVYLFVSFSSAATKVGSWDTLCTECPPFFLLSSQLLLMMLQQTPMDLAISTLQDGVSSSS